MQNYNVYYCFRHEFHKYCIDPWLLEHRTCPMCKMDILKHYGFVVSIAPPILVCSTYIIAWGEVTLSDVLPIASFLFLPLLLISYRLCTH